MSQYIDYKEVSDFSSYVLNVVCNFLNRSNFNFWLVSVAACSSVFLLGLLLGIVGLLSLGALGLLGGTMWLWQKFKSSNGNLSQAGQGQPSVITTSTNGGNREEQQLRRDNFPRAALVQRRPVAGLSAGFPSQGSLLPVRQPANEQDDHDDISTIPERLLASNNANSHRVSLSLQDWSAVTSPGFSTRVVRAAEEAGDYNSSGHRPFNYSPFQLSPNRNLGLGQIPYGSKWRRPLGNPPKSPSIRSYSYRDRERSQGRDLDDSLYLRIAPIDSEKAYSNGVGALASESNENSLSKSGLGLGGTLPGSMTNKMSRLWPSANNSVYESSSTTISPNILEALNNRKRTRAAADSLYDKTPPKSVPAGTSSVTVNGGEEIHKSSKRLKFIGNADDGNRSLSSVPLTSYHTSQDESMTSESILEQMNQTEKRFLPDDDSPPSIRPLPKKQRGNSSPRLTSTQAAGPSGYRKRRASPSSHINVQEEDEGKEKAPRFCTCSECYEEAAGKKRAAPPPSEGGLSPEVTQPKKRVTFSGDVKSSGDDDLPTPSTELSTPVKSYEPPKETTMRSPLAALDDIIDKEKYEADRKMKADRLSKLLDISIEKRRIVPITAARVPTQQPPPYVPAVSAMSSSYFSPPNAGEAQAVTTTSAGQSVATTSTGQAVVTTSCGQTVPATMSSVFGFTAVSSASGTSGPATSNSTSNALPQFGFSTGTTGSIVPSPATTTAEALSTSKPEVSTSSTVPTGAPSPFGSLLTQEIKTPKQESSGSLSVPAQPTPIQFGVTMPDSKANFSFGPRPTPTTSSSTSSIPVSTNNLKQEANGNGGDGLGLVTGSGTGFSFGTVPSSASTTSVSTPVTTAPGVGGFSFTSPSSSTSVSTPVSSTLSSAPNNSGFSFGIGNTAKSADSTPPVPSSAGFTFGQTAPTPAVTSASSGFSFGPTSSTPASAGAGPPSILNPSQAQPKPTSAFSFGQNESVQPQPALSTPGGFSFREQGKSAPAAAGGFSFADTSKPIFGNTSSTVVTASTTTAAPSPFQFGQPNANASSVVGASSTTPAVGLSITTTAASPFGGPVKSPLENSAFQSLPGKASPFQFGAVSPDTTSNASTGFGFGSNSTPSSGSSIETPKQSLGFPSSLGTGSNFSFGTPTSAPPTTTGSLPAPTTPGGFSFASPTPAGSGGFGLNSGSAATSSGFGFDAGKTTTTAPSTGLFSSFGQTNANAATPASGFSFGTTPGSGGSTMFGSPQPSTNPTSGFSFGSNASTGLGNQPAPGAGAFTFGDQNKAQQGFGGGTATVTPAPAPFQFNSSPAPTASTGGFNFSAQSQSPSPSLFGQQNAQPASGSPAFGQSTALPGFGTFSPVPQHQQQPGFQLPQIQQLGAPSMFNLGVSQAAPKRSQIRARRFR